MDPEEYETHTPDGWVRDPGRWVIFPRLSFANHRKIEERNAALTDVLSDYAPNRIESEKSACRKGIATAAICVIIDTDICLPVGDRGEEGFSCSRVT